MCKMQIENKTQCVILVSVCAEESNVLGFIFHYKFAISIRFIISRSSLSLGDCVSIYVEMKDKSHEK